MRTIEKKLLRVMEIGDRLACLQGLIEWYGKMNDWNEALRLWIEFNKIVEDIQGCMPVWRGFLVESIKGVGQRQFKRNLRKLRNSENT